MAKDGLFHAPTMMACARCGDPHPVVDVYRDGPQGSEHEALCLSCLNASGVAVMKEPLHG